MQKTPYKNPKKILAQIWRTLKRKISVTCCFTTRYADFCGERGSQTYGFLEYHKIHKYLYISYL